MIMAVRIRKDSDMARDTPTLTEESQKFTIPAVIILQIMRINMSVLDDQTQEERLGGQNSPMLGLHQKNRSLNYRNFPQKATALRPTLKPEHPAWQPF